MKAFSVAVGLLLFCLAGSAQGEEALLKRVKARLDKVNDYQAEGRLKIDVSFINAPESDVTVYYKRPDKFKVKKANGVSMLPKGSVSINLGALIPDKDYTVVPGGTVSYKGSTLRVVKLLPQNEASEVVLTTFYVDEKAEVIRKTTVTTKDNGTYEMEMDYGRYLAWGLPDKLVFSFNAREYKLPKGLTFEYEKGGKKETKVKDARGRVELTYKSYTINKGVPDAVFASDK